MSKLTKKLIQAEMHKIEHEASLLRCRNMACEKGIARNNNIIEDAKKTIRSIEREVIKNQDKIQEYEEYLKELGIAYKNEEV